MKSALRYSAYGEERFSSGDTPTDHRYTGQLSKMATVGLYYYNARWYDPYLNRFLSSNPKIQDLLNPLDWDRYAYTRNNPMIYTDPTGYDVDCTSGEGGCRQQVTIEKIESKYKVNIDRKQGAWSMSKLQAIDKGMDVLKKQMGDDQFIEQFSGVIFSVEATRTAASNRMYTWGHKDVVIGMSVSLSDYIMRETSHELAHIWDNNCGNCKSKGMEMLTGSYTTEQKFLFWTFRKTYHPNGRTPTEYAMGNSLEDWAESVTAVLFPGYASNNPWDERRQDYVRGNLDPDLRRTR